MSTTIVTPSEPKLKVVNNILENALLLVVTRRWPPTSKTISSKVLNSNASTQMISVSKKLFSCQELKTIISNETKLDELIKFRATPIPLKKGHHLLAVDFYHEVEHAFTEHVEKREKLINEFVAVYEEAINTAKELLGDQFNQSDYPSKEQIKSYFFFSWEYLEFGISAKLQQLDKEVAERKEEQFRGTITQAGEAAEQLLMAQMQMLVGHLAERLQPTGETNEDGSEKRKVFRDSMVEKVTDFLDNLPTRNLSQHEGLEALSREAKALVQGISPELLRTDDKARASISEGFTKIKDQLDKMLIDRPVRGISFEE